ncbi:hypothetical protein [Pseudomonas hunanensis]|uniref:hypothetical protein n=1 Tax=Pseudomonas hunanensis TaxID=1247546 RepID=UPI003D00A951
MELDDLKKSWSEASNQVRIDNKMIDQITKSKYKTGLKKIIYPEIIGILICILGAIYIGLHFDKLDTNLLKGTGVLAIIILVILPGISLMSLLQFNTIGDLNKPYSETLKDFATQKNRFHKLFKINSTLSYLLLVTVIVLLSKLFGENDITKSKYFWILSFSLSYIFLLFYSKWVAKYYTNSLKQIEDLLNELKH